MDGSIVSIDWPRHPRVQALCTTRLGGFSAAPFDSFNLGDHVGDAPAAVAHNRSRLAALLTGVGRPVRPVFLKQVHGSEAIVLSAQTPDGSVADAAVATQPGLACTVMVADCLPILLATDDGQAVAAVHAGWRGLKNDVIENSIKKLAVISDKPPENSAIENKSNIYKNISVWLGPCIGNGFFEVGAEVVDAFVSGDSTALEHFRAMPGRDGKWLADLAGLARQRLLRAGVTRIHGNDGSPAWCTAGRRSMFFSHRRDGSVGPGGVGGTGRFAACVWLDR
ncbi:MAG: hypothetical protein RLZZ126_1170 [Pseudomonadota bacterium]|jgi:polyphenol oxidase